MPSVLDVSAQVFTHIPPLIPPSRQKDFKTALTYLAKAYDIKSSDLPFTPQLEVDYRQRLMEYFEADPKGPHTVRNTLQSLAQLWRAWYQIAPVDVTSEPRAPVVPTRPAIPKAIAAKAHLASISPYHHGAWLTQHPYAIPESQWPAEVRERWQADRRHQRHMVRPQTLKDDTRDVSAYVSYLLLSPEARLAQLHEHAQQKLTMRIWKDDLEEITRPPVLTSWDELFDTGRLNGFVTWQAWRVHPWDDQDRQDEKPSRPNTLGKMVVGTIRRLAHRLQRPEGPMIAALAKHLPSPKKMHNKTASLHLFDFSELEMVAQALMVEARRTRVQAHNSKQPGIKQAVRFATGLVLALIWRNPLRARNWCEAELGKHIRQVDGAWRWHFEGHELKIGERHGEVNVFEPDVDEDIRAAFQEYLDRYRPNLPNANRDRHVFLSRWGTPLTTEALRTRLQIHCHRYTGKRLYTHLLRSLFTRIHLSAGLDLNSVAYALNDHPMTVLKAYNELVAEKHRPAIAEANRRALVNGNGHVLTPPIISPIPKPI
jgi:hypothetical protein